MGMRDTLKVLNLLKADGTIKEYAIGGAMGAMYYIEAITTIDLDVFVLLSDESRIDVLSPLYEKLAKMGYVADPLHGECVDIEGVPVQFLTAYNALLQESLCHAKTIDYLGEAARVIDAPYLAAICVQTGRIKDRLRVQMFLAQGSFEKQVFYKLLDRYGMTDKKEQLLKEMGENNYAAR